MAKTKSFTEELLFGFESEKNKKESNNVVEKNKTKKKNKCQFKKKRK